MPVSRDWMAPYFRLTQQGVSGSQGAYGTPCSLEYLEGPLKARSSCFRHWVLLACLNFFFLKAELLKEGETEAEREREKKIFLLLVHIPNVSNSQGASSGSPMCGQGAQVLVPFSLLS